MSTTPRKFTILTAQPIFDALESLAKREERTISQMSSMLIKEALIARGVEIVNESEAIAPTEPPKNEKPPTKSRGKKPINSLS